MTCQHLEALAARVASLEGIKAIINDINDRLLSLEARTHITDVKALALHVDKRLTIVEEAITTLGGDINGVLEALNHRLDWLSSAVMSSDAMAQAVAQPSRHPIPTLEDLHDPDAASEASR